MDQDPSPGRPARRGVDRGKRPYEAPAILFQQTLEVVAATCTQLGSKPDPILCPKGLPQS